MRFILFLTFGSFLGALALSPVDPGDNEIEHTVETKVFVPQMLSYVFDVLNIKGVVRDVKLGKTTSSTCTACKFGISMLKSFMESGKTEQEIADYCISVCKTLRLYSDRVCEGAVDLFKEQVFYVINKVVLDSNEICGLLLGRTCADVVNPFTNWTVPTSGKPKPPLVPVPPPQEGSPVLKVLHLTDIHYDPLYLEGSDADCGEPLCCRIGNGPAKSPDKAAGFFGDYRDCDTSYATLVNLLDHITDRHKLDMVFWTGDVAPHDIWNASRAENVFIVETVTQILKAKLGDVPVYSSVGNHESVPVNSFPPPEVKGRFDISWLYDSLDDSWGWRLPEEARATLKKGGFYSVKVQSGFRIIAINSNYCNSLNWWLLINSTDPAQQLEWLVDELQKAEDNNEKVHIISHIPPGKSDCLKTWSANFYDIINRYESTVMGQYYGHTHFDDFEIFYENGRASNVAYISPSVTTFGGVNPSYRVFTIDGDYEGSTRAILDHETYYLNLTEANAGKPVWRKSYSAKDVYGLKSLQPSDWDKLVRRFSDDDSLFQTFYRFYTALSVYDVKPCLEGCKSDMICQLKSAKSNDLELCASL